MSVNAPMAHKRFDIKEMSPRPALMGGGEGSKAHLDEILLAVGQQKSRDCFVELFEYFAPRIKSFFIKGGSTPEQADELAQETMLTVWNKAGSFDPRKATASTWIYTIARNKRVDSLRSMTRRNEVDLPEYLPAGDETPIPGESLAQEESNALISAALEDLPEDEAALIHKSFFEGKSHSMIAHETGIPLGTIKSRIRTALGRLRRNLKAGDLQ